MKDSVSRSRMHPWRGRLVLVYLALLLCSTVYRFAIPPRPNSEPGYETISIETLADERVDFRYQQAGSADAPRLLLLADDAWPERSLQTVIETLSRRYRVLVPRLPGGRGDPTRYGSYSATRQAERVLAFLDAVGWERGHVVGLGQSGTVALALLELAPQRAQSLVLASTAVAPNMTMLGDHTLNQALRAGEVSALWLAENGLPQFGLLERSGYGVAMARPGFDSDLRETSRFLSNWNGPVLYLAGEADWRVSDFWETTLRGIAPQLEYRLVPDAGKDVFAKPGFALAEIERFATDVALEKAPSRSVDSAAPAFDAVRRLNPWFSGILLAVATFASEDLACIGGGLLAAKGSVSLLTAVLGCLLGIFIGDFAIYLIGRVLGRAALDLPLLRRLATPEKLDRCAGWFERRGIALVVATRFFPGSRVPTYFAAGVVKVGVGRFAFALLVASAVWTPILVTAAFLLGDTIWAFLDELGAWAPLGALGLLVIMVLGSRLVLRMFTWRERRLLYSSWRRLVRWEYWPAWALYPPVVIYIAWLMLRYRSMTLPSVTNPCMPASGLVFESKSQILGHLGRFGAPVADYIVIELGLDPAAKLDRLDAFMSERDLDFPVVLKPDVGQRGSGVCIVRNPAAAEAFFANQVEDTIAQAYVPGVEFGVFYCRHPGEESGWVFSITNKRSTWVTGDGKSRLEELILRDARAVCMARFFLEEHAASLDRVPAAGERFELAELGTHCRGALFLDGAELLTPALEQEIDRFSRRIEGFHYGRFDIRVPSPEAFQRGEGIRVIELNGLTSESTNMYDPKHSLIFAWKTLLRQWRLVFEIAQKNRLAGYEPDSVRSIARLFIGYFRGVASKDLS